MDEKEAEARPLMGTIFLVGTMFLVNTVIPRGRVEYLCRYVSYVKLTA